MLHDTFNVGITVFNSIVIRVLSDAPVGHTAQDMPERRWLSQLSTMPHFCICISGNMRIL